MIKHSFDEVKTGLQAMVRDGLLPELSLFMNGKEYMIIAFEKGFSFQRCGNSNGSGEIYYDTLDELYNTTTVDGILLKKDWGDISHLECYYYDRYFQS